MDQEKSESEARETGKFVQINWTDPGRSVFANHVLIQSDQSSFYLTFYQINPPIILADTEDERRDALGKLESIEALSMVRVAVPKHQLAVLIEALKAHTVQSKEQ